MRWSTESNANSTYGRNLPPSVVHKATLLNNDLKIGIGILLCWRVGAEQNQLPSVHSSKIHIKLIQHPFGFLQHSTLMLNFHITHQPAANGIIIKV